MAFTFFCKSSRSLLSSFISLMEEIEAGARLSRTLAVGELFADDLVEIGFDFASGCLTASESDARGRTVDADLPAGELILARAAGLGAGFELVDDAKAVLVVDGDAGALGVNEARLLGRLPDGVADTPVEEAFEMAIADLDEGAEGELVAFLMGEAGVAAFVADALGAGFTVPVPNVPELIIYKAQTCWFRNP
jgi:hypothetical protein